LRRLCTSLRPAAVEFLKRKKNGEKTSVTSQSPAFAFFYSAANKLCFLLIKIKNITPLGHSGPSPAPASVRGFYLLKLQLSVFHGTDTFYLIPPIALVFIRYNKQTKKRPSKMLD